MSSATECEYGACRNAPDCLVHSVEWGNPTPRRLCDHHADIARANDAYEVVTERKLCPECGSPQVSPKSPNQGGPRENPEDYRCGKCGEHFDDPDRGTPSNGSIAPNTGLASELYDAGKERADGGTAE